MTATSSPPHRSGLDTSRAVAQIFTSGAAVVFAVVSLVRWAVDSTPAWVDTLDKVLLGAVMVGGIAMGALWVTAIVTGRDSDS